MKLGHEFSNTTWKIEDCLPEEYTEVKVKPHIMVEKLQSSTSKAKTNNRKKIENILNEKHLRNELHLRCNLDPLATTQIITNENNDVIPIASFKLIGYMKKNF